MVKQNCRELENLINEENENVKFQNMFNKHKDQLKWVRISDIIDDTYQLIRNPGPQDIIQGSVGNCYFLSVCSAISCYPNLLEKIFVTKEKNFCGIYCLNFFIDGELKKIIVDDYIPVLKYNNEPIFSKINLKSKNIWPLILEKAWAKLIGNYAKTSGGLPIYPFDVLLGVPCENIDLFRELNNIQDDEEDIENNSITPYVNIDEEINNKSFLIWEKLLSYFNENYLITSSISIHIKEGSSLKKELDDLGLVTFHAYTCIFFQEFLLQNNTIIRVVKLRNPWGKLNSKNFKGSLIKNNYYKNDDIRINCQINDEAEFILEYDEFKRFFSHIYISKKRNNYICNKIDTLYDNHEKQSKSKTY